MKNSSMEDAKLKFNLRQGITNVINENLVILIVFSIMILGSWFVITGALLIGSLIAVVQLLNSIMNPINLLLITMNNMNSTKSIREKIDDLLKEKENELKEVRKTKLVDKKNFINSIKVKNLSFGYKDDKKVIHDLNFEFEKGRKYAVIGESGCGKSTFLKLVQNYYDNYEGKIEIDGTDYKDIDEESFFNLFSVTHQNVFIFSGTIRDNITLFNDYDSETINEAVRLSGLEKLLNSLPEGLDTMINENGNSLSGGERQRISIARALVKNTPILILDEYTSSLDKKTSDEIEKEILALKEYTCIAVTHKLNDETKVLYDSIIYIDNGEIEKVENLTNEGKVG
jgi:ATP-binding cassette subfamily B protein